MNVDCYGGMGSHLKWWNVFCKITSSKTGYPQPKDEVVGVSYQLSIVNCQLSALQVILKFKDLEIYYGKISSLSMQQAILNSGVPFALYSRLSD